MTRLLLGGLVAFCAFNAVAQTPPENNDDARVPAASRKAVSNANSPVGSIVIKGNKKIETPAILKKLVSAEGVPYSLDNVRKDVTSLFSTGFFYDIVVDRSVVGGKVQLTYTVVEKPSVVEILYDGNEEVEDKDLAEASQLKAYEILDLAKVKTAVAALEKLYEEKGFFLARIRYRVEDVVKGETVKLHFEIVEGEMVKVKQIQFLGNKRLDTSKLKGAMRTQEGGYFSFITGSGAYKQDIFDQDVRLLNYLYFNEGFVQVKIDRPEVYVTPDKRGIYISIRIEEGEQFNIGQVDFGGDLLFSDEELLAATQLRTGDLFVSEKLQADLLALQAKYGDLGYAFTNVIPRTKIKAEEKIVDLTYEIDKGEKVHIGKINIVGNSKTRDKVVRREMEIREGELYHETRKRESQANIRRLGFFDEVTFNTNSPEGQPNVLDFEINVKERNTGTIQVGAGYSSYQKFVFNGQVDQANLGGRGQRLGVRLLYSEKESDINLNFTEPYFLDTEWSLGFDAYSSKERKTSYDQEKIGGAVRVGHPLAPYLRGFIRYKLDETKIELKPEGDPDLFVVDTANGTTSSLTFTLEYDKRDDRFAPTSGLYSSASIEYAGLGGDKKYTKGTTTLRYYRKIFWDLVWRNNITYGFIKSNEEGQEPPFNELFLLGGANTLRGYNFFSIGKKKFSNKAFTEGSTLGLQGEELKSYSLRPFGGKQQIFYNLEFQFPLIEEAKINGVVFYDIGYADDDISFDELRSDTGFGFRWYSPIGPLRFEWGFPVERQKEFSEDSLQFNFAIGAPF